VKTMISRVSNLFASKEFVKFIVVGGFAAIVNFMSRIVYSMYMGFSSAIIIAYITGMVVAFVLSKYLVFAPGRHHTVKEIGYFTLVNLAAIAQTWIVSMTMFHYILVWLSVSLYREEISHFIGIAVPAFTSYFGHKHFTFKAQ
jgi:putative flippase GtrA